MVEWMIQLNVESRVPIYQQIYEFIKHEIVDGKISVGERLPSTRLLSKSLQVSRSTVELSYQQLLEEGYIESEPCKGYYVCDVSEKVISKSILLLGKNGKVRHKKKSARRIPKERLPSIVHRIESIQRDFRSAYGKRFPKRCSYRHRRVFL